MSMLIGPLRVALNELGIKTVDVDGKNLKRSQVHSYIPTPPHHLPFSHPLVVNVVLKLRKLLADHIKAQVMTTDPESDPYINRTIWWRFQGEYYRGVISSKDLDGSGNVLYHVKYADGDEADLEMDDIESDEYYFTLPIDKTDIEDGGSNEDDSVEEE